MMVSNFFHNEISYPGWVRDTAHLEAGSSLSGSLGSHGAVIKEGGKESINGSCYILNMGEKEACYLTRKEPILTDMHHAGRGNNPVIEEVRRKDIEREYPQKEPPYAKE